MDLSNRTNSRSEAVKRIYSYEISSDIKYDELDEFALFLVKGVIDRLEEIDEIISANLFNYTINRLNLVDLAIIRIATLELIEGKLEKQIIINEAIELTKIYTNLDDDKAKAFNNKLLDNIAKYLESR